MGTKKTLKFSLDKVARILVIMAMTAPALAHAADDDETAGQYFAKDKEITAKFRQGLFQRPFEQRAIVNTLPLYDSNSEYLKNAPINKPKSAPSDEYFSKQKARSQSYSQKAKSPRAVVANDNRDISSEPTHSKLPPRRAAMEPVAVETPVTKVKLPPRRLAMESTPDNASSDPSFDASSGPSSGMPDDRPTVGKVKLPPARKTEAAPVDPSNTMNVTPLAHAKVGMKAAKAESAIVETSEKQTQPLAASSVGSSAAPTAQNPQLNSKIQAKSEQAAQPPAQQAVAQTQCEAPATGIQQTANWSKQMKETVQKANNSNPIVAQTETIVIDPEDEDYQKGWDHYQQKAAKKPVQTPAHALVAPVNEFSQNLLKYAKLEAAKNCRHLSGRTVCSAGRPKGACLQGVRMAFQRAKGESTASGWTMNAKDAGHFLPKYGYHKIAVSDFKNAPATSVFIYIDPNNLGRAGHIEIKGTDGFYSDFYSKYMINDRRGLRLNRQLKEVWVPN